MEFNSSKCHVIKFGDSVKRPAYHYELRNNSLQESDREKHLGVNFNNRLSPKDNIKENIRIIYDLLANVRGVFVNAYEDMVKRSLQHS